MIAEDYRENNIYKKSRNLSEKRRRDAFNLLVTELSTLVTVGERKLDKSNVLKQTIAYLKKYNQISQVCGTTQLSETWKPSFLTNDELCQLILEGTNAVTISFTPTGDILFVSDGCQQVFGLSVANMKSRSIFDMIADETSKSQLQQILLQSSSLAYQNEEYRKFQLNMKIQRNSHGYFDANETVTEAVQFVGKFKRAALSGEKQKNDSSPESTDFGDSVCFLGVAKLISPVRKVAENLISHADSTGKKQTKISRETLQKSTSTEFASRHNMEWRFTHLDSRATSIIGFSQFEVLGDSGYDYVHPDDLHNLAQSHISLISTGEGISCPYRFRTKGNSWLWVRTRFYLTYHQCTSKPEFVNCTHMLLRSDTQPSGINLELNSTEPDRDQLVSSSTSVCSNSPKQKVQPKNINSKRNSDGVAKGRSISSDRESLVETDKKLKKHLPQYSIQHSPITSNSPFSPQIKPPSISTSNSTANIVDLSTANLSDINSPLTAETVVALLLSLSKDLADEVANDSDLTIISPEITAESQLKEQLKLRQTALQREILQQQSELSRLKSQFARQSANEPPLISEIPPINKFSPPPVTNQNSLLFARLSQSPARYPANQTNFTPAKPN